MSFVEAPAKRGLDLSSCVFYHTVDLPRSGRQTGWWDLSGRFDDYTGHQDFAGRTVLDIGTATGFLTFEAERRGARVTSLDAKSADLYQELPIPGIKFVENYQSWRANAGRVLEGIKNSYWLCHEEFRSSARCFYGDLYELDGAGYDTVMLGQVLVHLHDALSAVAAAARVCAERLIIIEGNLEDDAPVARLCGRAGSPTPYAWYHYSHGWYREVLKMLGFRDVAITTGFYSCNAPHHAEQIELGTVVATR